MRQVILKNESSEDKSLDAIDLSKVSVGGLLEDLLGKIEASGGDFSKDTGRFFGLLRVVQGVYGIEAVRVYECCFDVIISEKRKREEKGYK